MKNEDNYYDERAYYEKTVAPIVKELELACLGRKMPMFLSVAVANNEEGTDFEHELLMGTMERHLTCNTISKYILRLQELNITPPDNIKKALNDVMNYLVERSSNENVTEVDRKLTSNLFNDFKRIACGGDVVSFEGGVVGKEIGTDLDIDAEESDGN